MNDAEYLMAQQKIMMFAGLVKDVDVSAFLARIDKAEIMGPLVNPTLYRKAAPALDTIKRQAKALLPFHEEVMKDAEKEVADEQTRTD